MINKLSMLFEADIANQDEYDDIESVIDDESENAVLVAMCDRLKDEKKHLFDNKPEEPVNSDGLTPEEERDANLAILSADEDFDDIDSII